MPPPALSLVLPVYDEAGVLAANLDQILTQVEGLGGEIAADFEVIAVDDGSADDSRSILEALAARDPRLRSLHHPANRGKGAAVRTGVLAARGRRVIFMDADLSTPLEEMPRFLAELDAGHDLVLGDRRAAASRITRRQPLLRQSLGKGFTAITRLLLAPGVHDFTCGFKAFRGEAAREVFSRSSLDGWAFDAELVVIARQLGLDIVQLPVQWHHEENTKVRLASAVLESGRDLLRILWRRLTGRYR